MKDLDVRAGLQAGRKPSRSRWPEGTASSSRAAEPRAVAWRTPPPPRPRRSSEACGCRRPSPRGRAPSPTGSGLGNTESLQTSAGDSGKHGAGPPRLASIYRLLSEKRAGRRRRPPLRRTAPPTSPGRRTAHGHTKHVSVFEERIGSVCVCLEPDLVSILQHTRSQERPQDVADRSAGAPQAKHEAPPGVRENKFSVETAKKGIKMSATPPFKVLYLDFCHFHVHETVFLCPTLEEKSV